MDAKFALATLIFLCSKATSSNIEIVQQWNFLDFHFPPEDELIKNFKPVNTILTGFEVTHDRIFVATPNLRSGVPATLSVIPRYAPPGSSPKLRAYPDWSFHQNGRANNTPSCDNSLITVYRIRVDSCNRLWVLDGGIATSIEDYKRICPPKILIFDLSTDRLIKTIIFANETYEPRSLFTNLIIDESVQGICDGAVVYIADTVAPAIVVYDSLRNTAWRLTHPSMDPEPEFSTVQIQGENMTLGDGIIGLAFSPRLATLYFQPLATDRIFSVPTAALRKPALAASEELPVALVGKKSSQGMGMVVNQLDETLFFSPLSETLIASWNPLTHQQKAVSYDPEKLQFVSEIRWYPHDGGSIWLLSTRFQKYFSNTLSPAETNTRIMRVPLQLYFNPDFAQNIIYF